MDRLSTYTLNREEVVALLEAAQAENARLKKQLDNELFQVGYQAKEIADLRVALGAVEWHTEEDDWQVCDWCHAGGWGNQKHEPDCQRQEALKEEG